MEGSGLLALGEHGEDGEQTGIVAHDIIGDAVGKGQRTAMLVLQFAAGTASNAGVDRFTNTQSSQEGEDAAKDHKLDLLREEDG